MSAQVTQPAITPSAEFTFTSSDGLRIACARWDSHGPARGLIQIAHGMGEHMGRYVETIEVLVSAGLTVYGNDHRGHGSTASSAKQFGDFGNGGFDLLVEDMVRLSRIAKDENPNLPFPKTKTQICPSFFLVTAWVLSRRSNTCSIIAARLTH